ncbi:hypothetical protein JCM10213_004454 [Rhodosporidiobolus nylandii]
MKYALTTVGAITAIATVASAESAPAFTPTTVEGVLVEQFVGDSWKDRWSPSKATKEEQRGEVFSYVGKWSVEEPTVYPGIAGDEGLVLKTKAAHHAISAPFDAPLDPKGKPLIVSYEVKLQKGLDCGGAYIKLLTESETGIQAEEFSDKTPYTIMFGPDRCGSTAKVHFIFRHTSPLTGEIEEKHLIAPPAPKTDKLSNLYTLVVRPDQTYEILINNKSAKKGSLLEDFSPAVNPPKEIDDPTDEKPADWEENPKISDPDATKPDDWDEEAPQTIEDPDAEMPDDWLEDESPVVPDPEAEKPEEWSDEDDGDWIAPSVPNPRCQGVSGCGPWKRPEVPNPAYKGKWFAPLIDNPAYKGPWAPRKIANPDYYDDNSPADFNKIAGVGFELWSMTEDILFDNIYVGQSEADLEKFISETYAIKAPLEAALEAADKPEPKKAADLSEEPDFKADPLAFAKFKVKQFVDEAVVDPKQAFIDRPVTGGVVGVAFATVVGIFGVLLSLLFGAAASPATQKKVQDAAAAAKKKTDAVTADAVDAASDAAEKVKEAVAPVTEAAQKKAEEVKEGVRTRAKAQKEKKVDSE